MKFAALALVGSAAACGHHKCTADHHGMKHHRHHFDFKEAFSTMFHAPKRCHLAKGDEMSTLHELRLIAQTSVKSWAQGYYQESGDVVSDECFGEWMHDSFEKIKAFVHTWRADPLAVELEDYYAISREIVDLIFKNKDTCNLKKQTDDFKVWCTDNEDVCLLGEGMEQRLLENSVDIVGTFVDIVHILERDDTCYTSKEQLAEYSRLVKDFGELTAAATGFDLKWDQTHEQKHIKRSAFRTAVKGFYHRRHMTFKEIMEFDFPELSGIVEDILKALHHFLHLVKGEVKKVMTELHKEVIEFDKEIGALMPKPHHFSHITDHFQRAHHEMSNNFRFKKGHPLFSLFMNGNWA